MRCQLQLDRGLQPSIAGCVRLGSRPGVHVRQARLKGDDDLGDTFAFPSASAIPASMRRTTRSIASSRTGSPTFRIFRHPVVRPRDAGWQVHRIDVGCQPLLRRPDYPSTRADSRQPGTFPYQNIDMRLRKDFPRFGRTPTAFGITLDVFNVTQPRQPRLLQHGQPDGRELRKGRLHRHRCRRYQLGAELNF